MPSFSPRFVKAKIAFWVDKKLFTTGEHLINSAGVPGFVWTNFNPVHAVGKKTQVVVEVVSNPPYEFVCNGAFTCERSEKTTFLGISFVLSDEQRVALEAIIAREGTLPEYVRKFPRIPYSSQLAMMPSRVILRYFMGTDDITAVCDVDNISPTGLQVFTEDRRTATLNAGEVLQVQIQPRGSFEHSISLNAAVKRVLVTIDAKTSNNRWYFGLSIMTISDHHRALLADLLRGIAMELKGS